MVEPDDELQDEWDSFSGKAPQGRLRRAIAAASNRLLGPVRGLFERIQNTTRRIAYGPPKPEDEAFLKLIGHVPVIESRASRIRKNLLYWAVMPLIFIEEILHAIASGLLAFILRIPDLIESMWCREFLFGLPALIGVGVGIYAFVVCVPEPPRLLSQKYDQFAQDYVAVGDYESAKLCLMRSLATIGDTARILYHYALAQEASGEVQAARATMENLAPLNGTGYGPAHMWLANEALKSKTTDGSNASIAELHLLSACKTLVTKAEAEQRLGRLCLSQNRRAEAEKHLKAAADDLPVARFELARLHAINGKPEAAKAQGELALAALLQDLGNSPNNADLRLVCAHAAMFLERFPEALTLLREGLSRNPDSDRRLNRGIAEVFAAWSDAEERAGRTDQAITLIQEGLKTESNNAELFARIERLLNRGPKQRQRVSKVLDRMLLRGDAPAMVHFILANERGKTGDVDGAIRHLEMALALDQKFILVTNNLAWYVAHSKNPDLPRALRLIESAIKLEPENPAVRDTRGRILVKLNRPKEAVADLTFALPHFKNDPDLHESLSDAYAQLGMKDMAETYAKSAKTLRSQITSAAGNPR